MCVIKVSSKKNAIDSELRIILIFKLMDFLSVNQDRYKVYFD